MNNRSLFVRHVFEHFYLGIIVTAVYVLLSPLLVSWGYPGFGALLFVELLVLAPIVAIHLLYKARKLDNSWSLDKVILFREKIGFKRFALWLLIGIIGVNLAYIPLYPVGLYFRTEFFAWLPEWYFNPGYGVTNVSLLANMFLLGIVIDGIIGPVAEELFFRGYLLPRMSYLKAWAPFVNGAFFGIYHFWQPHNLLALIAVGCVLSFVVWKTKNVYVGIAIHCTMNIVGAIGGYLAVTGGVDLMR